jgi:hypothetical protein
MTRPQFSSDELKPTGKFYPSMGSLMNMEIPPQPVLNRPVEARENFKLLFSGKKPWWIPTAGWALCDVNQFRPRIHPDNIANHQVFDGGPRYDYSKQGEVVKSSWFDLDWVWVNSIGGATVLPGKPKVPDILEWEKYVTIPNLDDMDWNTCAKQNVEYLGSDKLNELGLQCGFWERLMSFMDVAEAAMALYEDESKPGVHRLFNALVDLYCDYLTRMKKICNIEALMLHDDWAHARAPFMSVDTLREMELPYLKRVIDHCHSLGMYYEIHCCGACEQLIPFFIETGADMWCGQTDLNDTGAYAKKYRNSNFVFGVQAPTVPMDAPVEEVRRAAQAWVEEYKDCHVALLRTPGITHPGMSNAIYEYSRIAYQDAED